MGNTLKKQQKQIREFQDWVWKNADRKAELLRLFNDKKGAIDQFDGRLKGLIGFFDGAVVEPQEFMDVEDLNMKKPASEKLAGFIFYNR